MFRKKAKWSKNELAKQKKAVLEFLETAFEHASEDKAAFCDIVFKDKISDGMRVTYKVFVENPEIEKLAFNIGPTIFRIANCKPAIAEVMGRIKKPYAERKLSYSGGRGSGSAEGRWPYNLRSVSFPEWGRVEEDCLEFSNGWSAYERSLAFRKTGFGKVGRIKKLAKDFVLPSNMDIPVKIVCAERIGNSAETIVMRSETGEEYYYIRLNFEKLYGVLKWKRPSYRIVNRNEDGGNTLGIFENGRPIAYLGEYRQVQNG